MDFMFLENLILLLKAGAVSLTIFSSITYLAYFNSIKSKLLSVENILSNTSHYIGKTVKVVGNATGNPLQVSTK